MILVKVTSAGLLEAIRSRKKRWLATAKTKTAAAVAAGKVGERDGIWSQVKEIYILLQHFKCIYCESPMAKVEEASARGVAVEYDIEHFRPKNAVTPWPTPETLARRLGIDYADQLRSGVPQGYVRLAFDPLNYVVSCKTCNTFYKLDHFPIAGTADVSSTARAALDARELPLLLFPFGDDGDAPEAFFEFFGPLVHPRPAAGFDRLRARVVIDFFELDTRAGLLEARSALIGLLWPQLEERADPSAPDRQTASDYIDALRQDDFPHAACARAYVSLYESDRARARQWYELARKFSLKKDPKVFSVF
jgi:hypothetical protein